MKQKNTATKIFQLLNKKYPQVKCGLDFNNTFELLIATILSAQCTDKMVNKVTPNLFAKYPNPQDLKKARLPSIEAIIRPTGFYKNKAKNIKAAATEITDQYKGQIPKTMDELIRLPGVGRKTANVVLSNGYGINVGVVVDTHVTRISNLLKLTESKNPIIIERDLMDLFPEKDWGMLSHLFITLGREICIARRPKCEACPLEKLCISSKLKNNS